jgi:hypothetical protein
MRCGVPKLPPRVAACDTIPPQLTPHGHNASKIRFWPYLPAFVEKIERDSRTTGLSL